MAGILWDGIAMHWALAFGLVATACLAATGGLLTLELLTAPGRAKARSLFDDSGLGAVFLFDGEALIDCSPTARALLAGSSVRGGDWARMLACLATHFPDLEDLASQVAAEGRVTRISNPVHGTAMMLQAEGRGGLLRICLADAAKEGRAFIGDPLIHRAMTEELDLLRGIVGQAPVLVWQETAGGEVVWANMPYLDLALAGLPAGQEITWPLPRLFERKTTVQVGAGQRASLLVPEKGTLWFELTSQPVGGGQMLYATPADAIVHAEGALRDFMQTLTKTFAQLPIGLAIFDRHRQLQLFNPALVDLTGLPPDFLSLRPSLLSVLDALRDRNMIPEPKDYRHWRQQLVDMEKAAASGLYEEVWNLSDGQTFRVVGRPHPNGAIALMLEDISSETLRTRRYRADLELGQSVIDQMDEGVTVFSQSGQLVMSNAAYATLWGHDPAASLAESTVQSLSGHWRKNSAPGALWTEVEDYVATVGDRVGWTGETRLLDGRRLLCRFAPLAGGATLASFCVAETVEVVAPKVAKAMRRA